jgi:enoyl-CoA hydratase/3-hydroxyacyl-CoA dehydrogenase
LPRLIGLERGVELLRTGRPVGAKQACEWGWASGEPSTDIVGAACELIRSHLEKPVLVPVAQEPVSGAETIPPLDIGHLSLTIDEILVGVIRDGLARPLAEGLMVETDGFARCKQTVDYDIGMKNFIQNGPRVPAAFMHE